MNLVTIVPPEPTDSGITLTQGTRVLLSDGTELQGVVKIVLTAEPNNIWRAQIDCNIRASELPNVLAQIEATAVPQGVIAEATNIADGSRRWSHEAQT